MNRLIEESIRIVADNQEIVDDRLMFTVVRSLGGSQRDVLSAQSESDKLEVQLINLNQRREQARAQIERIAGCPLAP